MLDQMFLRRRFRGLYATLSDFYDAYGLLVKRISKVQRPVLYGKLWHVVAVVLVCST